MARRRSGGLDSSAFTKALRDALEANAQKAREAAFRSAQAIRTGAIRHSPVDTGRLRTGWQVDVDTNTSDRYRVRISNRVAYAAEVELGHTTKSGSRVRPQPMLQPAVADVLGVHVGSHLRIVRR
jgi:hypothetical protein